MTDVIELDMNPGAIVTTANNIAGVASNQVVILQSSLTSSVITTDITSSATNSFILVHNSSSQKAELWFDDNWATTGNRTLVATFDNITTLAGVTNFVPDDFILV